MMRWKKPSQSNVNRSVKFTLWTGDIWYYGLNDNNNFGDKLEKDDMYMYSWVRALFKTKLPKFFSHVK
jgi:hypothetical protein